MAKKTESKKRTKRVLDVSADIVEAAKMPPVKYLEKWWKENSTEEERKAADERDATIEGSYSFIEDFVRRFKTDSEAVLPDAMAYQLCGIFMRLCVDGDVYATAEEIAEDEKREKEEAEREAKWKEEAEKRKAEAEKTEAERVAAMTAEERLAYEREKALREAREAEAAEAKRKADEARAAAAKLKAEKEAEKARKKALAEEMEKRQMTFF